MGGTQINAKVGAGGRELGGTRIGAGGPQDWSAAEPRPRHRERHRERRGPTQSPTQRAPGPDAESAGPRHRVRRDPGARHRAPGRQTASISAPCVSIANYTLTDLLLFSAGAILVNFI